LAGDNLIIFDSSGTMNRDPIHQAYTVTFAQLRPGVVVIASFNSLAVIYDWTTRTVLSKHSRMLPIPPNCLLPFGSNQIVSTSFQGIEVWNVETGIRKILYTGSAFTWITGVSPLQDGSFVSSDLDGLMMVIDLYGNVTHAYDTKMRPSCFTISRDGSVLCGTSEGVVMAWTVKTR